MELKQYVDYSLAFMEAKLGAFIALSDWGIRKMVEEVYLNREVEHFLE